MRIALLCRNAHLYSHQRLIAAGRDRGHDVVPLDHLRCTIDIATARPRLLYNGKPLERFDAVIPRVGASVTFFGTAVVRQFEMMGTYCLNTSSAIASSRDKLRSLQKLARRGIGLPNTVFAHRTSDATEAIRLAGGAPVVIKLLEGTQGIGVVLGETEKGAESIIQAFGGANINILVQEYVKEAGGEDIRCLVVGDRVVASMKRKGREGDFRSNLHRGGSAKPVRISAKEREIAVKAAKTMGLNMCGVDMLRSNHGPVVLEVNSSPGLEGVEAASGVDVAGKAIAFIEKALTERPQRRRRKGG